MVCYRGMHERDNELAWPVTAALRDVYRLDPRTAFFWWTKVRSTHIRAGMKSKGLPPFKGLALACLRYVLRDRGGGYRYVPWRHHKDLASVPSCLSRWSQLFWSSDGFPDYSPQQIHT